MAVCLAQRDTHVEGNLNEGQRWDRVEPGQQHPSGCLGASQGIAAAHHRQVQGSCKAQEVHGLQALPSEVPASQQLGQAFSMILCNQGAVQTRCRHCPHDNLISDVYHHSSLLLLTFL